MEVLFGEAPMLIELVSEPGCRALLSEQGVSGSAVYCQLTLTLCSGSSLKSIINKVS